MIKIFNNNSVNDVLIDYLEKTILFNEHFIGKFKQSEYLNTEPFAGYQISRANKEIELLREMITDISIKKPSNSSSSKKLILKKYVNKEWEECAHKIARLLISTEMLKKYTKSENDINNQLNEISKLSLKYELIERMFYFSYSDITFKKSNKI